MKLEKCEDWCISSNDTRAMSGKQIKHRKGLKTNFKANIKLESLKWEIGHSGCTNSSQISPRTTKYYFIIFIRTALLM